MALTGEGKQIGGAFQAGVDDAPPPPQKQENSAAGPSVIRYRECLKNHAVSIGGSVTDGCGEFMPCGEEGTVASLKCVACNCHRSFHRQETPHGGGGAPPPSPPALPSFASMTHRHNAWASLAAQSPKTPAFGGAAPPTPSPATATAAAAVAVASSFQEPNFNPHKCFSSAPYPYPANTAAAAADDRSFNGQKCLSAAPAAETRGKKRFRTKFTAEQKEKMAEFAEKIGWRIPREEESIHGVERLCGEIGVKKQVFKVWMHNNKSSAKPNATSHPPLTTSPSQSSSSSINN